jgi:uncharacterized protein (DUF1015 family)
MAKIKPFKGLRPQKGLEKKIASLPYDVMNSKEARELAKGDEYTFLHIVKPEIDLDENTHLYDQVVYDTARNNLQSFIEKKWLVQDKEDSLYVYKQKMGDHEQFGLVVDAACDDYDNDIIKKHEYTRPEKENDRAKHVHETGANAGPVFLTYNAQESIDSIINNIVSNQTPEYDFTASDDISHTFWVVKDKEILENLVAEFAKVDYLYVADGHHRAASGSRTRKLRKEANKNHTGNEEYNYFLTVLFPGNQLKILPYNRAVKDLYGLDSKTFMERLGDSFEVSETDQPSPAEIHTFCMYLDNKWYKMKAKDSSIDSNDPVKGLDVSILQNNVLTPLLGIEDPRTDNRIHFVGGIRGTKELEKLVNSGEFKVAFSMYPTRVEDIMNVAKVGEVMPPKSTWFEPKLRSGLIVHLLDD